MTPSIVQFLKSVEIFKSLTEKELAILAPLMVSKDFAENFVVVEEGQVGDTFFLIQSGMVSITRGNGNSKTFIAHLSEGQHFGEAALFQDQKRIANVEVSEPTRLLALSRSKFEEFLRTEPAGASRFLLQLVKQLLVRLEKAGSRIGLNTFDPLDSSEIEACLSGKSVS